MLQQEFTFWNRERLFVCLLVLSAVLSGNFIGNILLCCIFVQIIGVVLSVLSKYKKI